MAQPRVHTWSFAASTSEGTPVTLRAYLADGPLVDTANEPAPHDHDHSVIVTYDGELVERVDKGVYTLVSSGTTLSSTDPNAP
jgi:hypothetical protein